MALTIEQRTELAEALAGYLKGRRAAGEETVWVSPEAKDVLRALHRVKRAGAGGTAAADAGSAPTLAEAPALAPPAGVSPADEGPMPSLSAVAAELRGEEVPPEPAAGANQEAALPAEALVPEGANAAEKIAWLAEKAQVAPGPRALKTLRESMVFSVGNPEADLMLVGEAPGYEEERQAEPFVGPSGQLLDKILGVMGLGRGDIYISNVCKFRPAIPNQGTSNRRPTPEELAACLPFVKAEVEVVRPKVIVALGGSAVEGLLGEPMPVGPARGRFHDFEGIPLAVTYHPSYLLRNQALGERRKVWEDMLKVMDKLGMQISEKQRGFFLPK